MAGRSVGVGTKRRRKEYVDKKEQNYEYTYKSEKKDVGVLKKSKGYDTGLTKTIQEKRGRKKSDSRGKVTERTRTETEKVRNKRSNKQHKAKHGGK